MKAGRDKSSWFLLIAAISSLTAASGRAGEQVTGQGPASPEVVIQDLIERSPELAALDEQVAAAGFRVPQVGALPDPQLMVGLSNWPTSGQTPLTGVQIELSQRFPWFGKLTAAERAAERGQAAMQALRSEREFALVARAWHLMWELRYLTARVEILGSLSSLLDQVASAVEVAYAAGKGSQQDLIRPALEKARIADSLRAVEQRRNTVRSALNSMRARPTDAAIEPPSLNAPLPPKLDGAALFAFARDTSPLLRAAEEGVHQQRHSLVVAEKDHYPDITLGLQYRVRWIEENDPVQGADYFGVKLGLSLPIWAGSKQGMREQEVLALIRAAEQTLQARGLALREAIEATVQAVERDRAQIALYEKQIIPETERAFQSSLGDYQAGRVEIVSVLSNLAGLHQAQDELVRRQTRIRIGLAELDHLLGGSAHAALAAQAPGGDTP